VLLKSKNGNPVFGHSREISRAVLSRCGVVYYVIAKQYGLIFQVGGWNTPEFQVLIFG